MRYGVLFVAGLLSLSGIACADSTGPDGDGVAPPGAIVFVSDRTGASSSTGQPLSDIFRANADGSDVVNLTDQPAVIYRHLQLSPNGRTLLFESDRVGCANVWSMALDTRTSRQLTGGAGERCNERPRWSRDGARVGFATSREPIERSWETWVMDADGIDPHNVSDDGGLADGGADWPHGWWPDGRLVFHHETTGQVRTFIVGADGANREPILEPESGIAPFPSPDGSRVVFMALDGGHWEIFVMGADGTDIRNLSNDPGDDTLFPGGRTDRWVDPWSPDGTRLAFSSDRTGDWEIFVVGEDGTGLTDVTSDPAEDRFAGWSPGGGWIAFESDRDGPWHVFAAHPDQGRLWRVTEGAANDTGAVWVGSGS